VVAAMDTASTVIEADRNHGSWMQCTHSFRLDPRSDDDVRFWPRLCKNSVNFRCCGTPQHGLISVEKFICL
jgi:hypothetical protein